MTDTKCCGFYKPCRMPDCLPELATPRTDAVQNEMGALGRIDGMDAISAIHLCRQLERELQSRGPKTPSLADEVIGQINQLCDHQIPYYAYGDNQAACEMANRLEEIAKALPTYSLDATGSETSKEKT